MPTFRATLTIANPVLGGGGTNTWHLRTASEVVGLTTEADGLMDIIQTFYEAISSMYAGGTDIRFDGEYHGVGTSEGQFLSSDARTFAINDSGGSLPPANAICVNWRGQSGDRSRRGRTFLGPCGMGTANADGTIETATLTAIRGEAAALIESSDSFNNGALGVWSRQESVFRDFVATSTRDQFAVLRSRRD